MRAITVREAARFQSFPDKVVFSGLHSTQMRHVGNAVPPILASALAEQISRDLLAAGVKDSMPSTSAGRGSRPETADQRSRVMRAVPSEDTSPELVLRRLLSQADLRGYRLHNAGVPGRPDVVFGPARLAVFIDGCFWHGCPRCYRAPKTHHEYWSMKVERNRARDAKVNELCEADGWRVLRVWEHDVLKRPAAVLAKIKRRLAVPAPRPTTSRSPKGRNPGQERRSAR